MTYRRFIFGKIVRDGVLRDCLEQNCRVDYEQPTGAALTARLADKLLEEAEEIRAAQSREELMAELGDLLDVIDAIRLGERISTTELDVLRKAKAARKGGFAEGILIHHVDVLPDNPYIEVLRQQPAKYADLGEVD